MASVLITGGSRGIGAAAVRAFAARGDQVTFLYEKNHEAAQAVARNRRNCHLRRHLRPCRRGGSLCRAGSWMFSSTTPESVTTAFFPRRPRPFGTGSLR
ncbi:MAG: SDR family NAD(P)-dependent oxidoreductase [Oscillospiraceae bacterium]